MFNKDAEEINIKSAETIIGPSIKVKGNFHGQGNIIIEGEVAGSIKTDNNLLIGNKAIIAANIESKEAKIGGKITGNIKVKGYLEITSSAKIYGDIEAATLSIEKGATLNGKCIMGKNETIHSEKK
ncbi:MAG: polymer-forming cytoskeletal protein [Patescibacteria group bacterium]|nr:polymer-forming cytoskeletal protein [Patescibacteria group bacterium]